MTLVQVAGYGEDLALRAAERVVRTALTFLLLMAVVPILGRLLSNQKITEDRREYANSN